jgi:ABC-2 type transport system permease protein
MFSNTWTIAKKDLKSYFFSPVAYVVIALILLIMGYMFTSILKYAQMALARQAMNSMMLPMSLQETVVKGIMSNLNLILLLLVPFLTMRLFSEEHKQHTMELLMTAPVTVTEIVLGKFLAATGFLAAMIGSTLVFMGILIAVANPDIGPIVTSFIGSFLMATCYIGIGLFFSAMTENQVLAGAGSFVTSLFFWIISWAASSENHVIKQIGGYLSLNSHFETFATGVIQLSDLVYYFSFIGVSLFLTHRVVDSYRWK